jgi:hypothetical protein
MAGAAIGAQIRFMPARLRYRLGLGRSLARVQVEDLTNPGSSLCQQAEEILDERRPSEVVSHSHRTFAWARILARHEQVEHDPEILYVAALLHDLGLAAPGSGEPRCFTLVGADRAEALAGEAGLGPESMHAVAEAITLHMNVEVPVEQGPEAHLLAAGAHLDVAGTRYWELSRAAVDTVLAKHPRRGSKPALAGIFRREAQINPATRAAVYDRLTRGRHPLRAPFAE